MLMILLDISQAGTGIGIKQAVNLQNQSFVTKAYLVYHHIKCLKTLLLFLFLLTN